ncbi:UDP-N-acetylmuramoyl-tripeptide--D-alanyl-D-alanine ligase [uncultured Bacteroides sp.]|uniref:UDP-N-acetylmuramoyl-tripeptide--D-alanyl-D- alanine ligase n=1 Tax=uncultured Bacteroides sp. TaxID=162156 RepID=UPI00260C3FE9|nr:UDP-N-acetylmuramoyl-tripeptide--D-alanyl-D-alanine ligase [uncultured Bacteroides sp.]
MDITALYRIFQKCTCVTTDSRNCPKNSLFIALKGENFNGNAFAAKALESGSSYVVIDEADYAPVGDVHYIIVDNCLQTLQQLANYHRRQLGTRIIGITGTNGKTTTKELMGAVLSQSHNVLYTLGNLNNAIGVPLTLLRLTTAHDLAIVEMGASHPGDIKELAEIAEPDYGIITNVGKAHLEGFKSFEGVIKTKGELYDYLRQRGDSIIFIHQDNSYLKKMAGGLNQIVYGSAEDVYVNGRVVSNSPYLTFEWKAGKEGEIHHVQTQLIGEYNFSNALAAVTIGRFFGVEPAKIDKALAEYLPQNNRSQLKKTADNILIVDAYNANPTSMIASISNFRNMEAAHKMLILGDMRELGKDSAEEHQKIVDYLEECNFENVALVGEQFAATHHSYPTYPDANTLIIELQKTKPTGKMILIKGSNGIKLSTVIDYL